MKCVHGDLIGKYGNNIIWILFRQKGKDQWQVATKHFDGHFYHYEVHHQLTRGFWNTKWLDDYPTHAYGANHFEEAARIALAKVTMRGPFLFVREKIYETWENSWVDRERLDSIRSAFHSRYNQVFVDIGD